MNYPRSVLSHFQQSFQLYLCPTPISAVRGSSQSIRGTTRCVRDKDRVAHDGGQGVNQFESRRGQCYDIPTRIEVEAFDVVITDILPVCYRYTFILFDPGSTFSYVSTYFAFSFDVACEALSMLLYVFNPMGDFLMVD